VWVDGDHAAEFDEIWEDPPGRAEMPDGSVIVKVTFESTDCSPAALAGFFVMQKRAGFDPEGGNWYWQELAADRKVLTDGRDEQCSSCHRGRASCEGFGAESGRDYTCTEP
jgi:hypothetical protein